MLTAKDIIDTAFTPGGGQLTGRLEGLRRKSSGGFSLGNGLRSNDPGPHLPGVMYFIKRAGERSSRTGAPTPVHPAEIGETRPPKREDQPSGLSAAQIAWLSRLPSDPEQVRFDDAVALAAVARDLAAERAAGRGTNGDQELLESVWGPVRDLHRKRVVDARLADAQRPVETPPAGTTDALAEVLQLEDPSISADVAMARAATMLTDAQRSRESQRQTKIDWAKQEVAELEAHTAHRERTEHHTGDQRVVA